MSRKDGDILAYVGSDFYGDPKYAGSIDFANTPRSAGSTLKPFIYALGLESGQYTAAPIVDDLPPRSVSARSSSACTRWAWAPRT